MNTDMKFAVLARSALGASVLFIMPALAWASNQGDDIVVSSGTAIEQWQKQTNARLDRALRNASTLHVDTDNTIVQLTFTSGPDGKAVDPQFINSEGSWMERRLAKQAVKRLDNLDEVPVARPGEVKFIANIIFADDYDSLKKLRSRLEVMERERLATNDERSTYIALGY